MAFQNFSMRTSLTLLYLILSFITAYLWLQYPRDRCCESYSPDYTSPISYKAVLDDHSNSFFETPLPGCIGIVIAGLLVIFLAKPKWLIGFFLPTVFLGCCGLFVSVIPYDGTTLEHQQTLNFSGKTYHLVTGYVVGGGLDVTWKTVILFECEGNSDLCRARELTKYYRQEQKPSMYMNENQLIVYLDTEPILRIYGECLDC